MASERERESYTIGRGHVPNILKYQFTPEFTLPVSDSCCKELKEKPLREWEKQNKIRGKIMGLMREEGGRRNRTDCFVTKGRKMSFSPLAKISHEWEEWFIKEYNIQLCELYYPPYNFDRTGCKGCPYNINIQRELDTLEKYFPSEKKQCEFIWKPVYDEYRRIGYRLKSEEQIKLF